MKNFKNNFHQSTSILSDRRCFLHFLALYAVDEDNRQKYSWISIFYSLPLLNFYSLRDVPTSRNQYYILHSIIS